jgi:Na+/H+ antiporter NhaA
MVPLLELWLPVLVSAVFAFVASSIVHMVLPFHRSDYRKLPAEDETMRALRPFRIPPATTSSRAPAVRKP